MNSKIFKIVCVIAFVLTATTNCQSKNELKGKTVFSSYLKVPMAGNSWADQEKENSRPIITKSGVENWDNAAKKINAYFRTGRTGKVDLAIRVRVKSGKSKINCQLGSEHKDLSISNIEFDTLRIGSFNLKNAGYQSVILSGLEKTADSFAEITDLLIGGEAIDPSVRYVKDDFYWGRRGPSASTTGRTRSCW